jgi:hypothetical protein
VKYLLLILISLLLLSSPVIGQSSKPLGVVLPPTVMGNVSNSRKQILLNTLDEEVSKYFDVSPPTNVSSGEIPVVEDVFQIQIIEEDGDTQLSLRWTSGKERKVETDYCEGCKTKILNEKVKRLIEKLVGGKRVEVMVEKKEKGVLYERRVNGKWEWYKSKKGKRDSKYVGEIENGKPNGQGTLSYLSGTKYVGEYKDGKKNGQGTQTGSDGEKYVGEWKDGKRNGQGTETFPNGSKYVGEWKNGKENGQGTTTFRDGDKYVGEYKNGKTWNGTGYDKDGNILGKMVNGKFIKQ